MATSTKPYKYKNITSDTVRGKAPKKKKVGDAEFTNAKNSRYAYEGSGTSSSTVSEGKGDSKWSLMTTHSEPARQYRLGKKQTSSGPKSRKTPDKKKGK